MKTLKHITFILFLIATVCTACSKDDVTPSSKNSLTLNGNAFAVTMVSLTGISIENEGHAGITFTGTEGTKAKALSLDIEYSPSQAVDGTYAYPQTEGTRYLDDWLTNYTEMSPTGDVESTNLEKGNVTIKDNGDSNFTITMDLEMVDGKIFKGTYQGKVQEVYNNQ